MAIQFLTYTTKIADIFKLTRTHKLAVAQDIYCLQYKHLRASLSVCTCLSLEEIKAGKSGRLGITLRQIQK